jgi:hypothetical protein
MHACTVLQASAKRVQPAGEFRRNICALQIAAAAKRTLRMLMHAQALRKLWGEAAVRLQACGRRALVKRVYMKKLRQHIKTTVTSSAQKLQAHVRTSCARRMHVKMAHSATTLSTCALRAQAARILQGHIRAARCLQAHMRACVQRRIKHATRIQCAFRAHRARKLSMRLISVRDRASTTLQAACRRACVQHSGLRRIAAARIQAACKRVAMQRSLRKSMAACVLAAKAKAVRVRAQRAKMKAAATSIQAMYRGHMGRRCALQTLEMFEDNMEKRAASDMLAAYVHASVVHSKYSRTVQASRCLQAAGRRALASRRYVEIIEAKWARAAQVLQAHARAVADRMQHIKWRDRRDALKMRQAK